MFKTGVFKQKKVQIMAIKIIRRKEERDRLIIKSMTGLLSKEERGRLMIRNKHKGGRTKG